MSILAVVADGKSWANFHRSLSGGLFFISLWLLEKINRGFVIRCLEKIGRFLQTRAAHRTSQIYVPGAGSIEWLFARFVGHRSPVLPRAIGCGNVFIGGTTSVSSQE